MHGHLLRDTRRTKVGGRGDASHHCAGGRPTYLLPSPASSAIALELGLLVRYRAAVTRLSKLHRPVRAP
jgi:hypothetical protein